MRKDLMQLARQHTNGAVQTLVGIMNQPKSPAAARVTAATVLLDRGWGKAPQIIAGDPDNPIIHHHDAPELARQLAFLLDRGTRGPGEVLELEVLPDEPETAKTGNGAVESQETAD